MVAWHRWLTGGSRATAMETARRQVSDSCWQSLADRRIVVYLCAVILTIFISLTVTYSRLDSLYVLLHAVATL